MNCGSKIFDDYATYLGTRKNFKFAKMSVILKTPKFGHLSKIWRFIKIPQDSSRFPMWINPLWKVKFSNRSWKFGSKYNRQTTVNWKIEKDYPRWCSRITRLKEHHHQGPEEIDSPCSQISEAVVPASEWKATPRRLDRLPTTVIHLAILHQVWPLSRDSLECTRDPEGIQGGYLIAVVTNQSHPYLCTQEVKSFYSLL